MSASPGSHVYPSRLIAWCVVGLLFGAAIIAYSDRQVMSLLVDPIRQDLGITDVQMGLLIGTAFAIIYGLAGIPLGYLADRTSRRNLIVIGMVVWSLATVFCGFARSFGQVFAGRIVVGLGEAVLSPAAVSLIGDFFPVERRGAALGAFFTGVALGIGSAVTIGGALLSAIESGLMAGTPLGHEAPWRLMLILIGAPGILWALAMLTFHEPRRTTPDGGVTTESTVADAARRAKRRRDWWRLSPMFLVVAMPSLVDNTIAAWSPSLLIRAFHLSAARTGVILGPLFMIGGALGMLAGGFASDQIGGRSGWSGRVYLCLGAALLAIPCTLLVTSSTIAVIQVAIALLFVASAIMTSSGLAAILERVPANRRGVVTSICFFVNVAFGLGVGPPAVALSARYLFAADASLAFSLLLVIAIGYLIAVTASWAAIRLARGPGSETLTEGRS